VTTSKDIVCGVCGRIKTAHDELNHEFDVNGVLRAKEVKQEPRVVSGLDIPLRLLLVDKGIITAEELGVKEALLREQLAQARRNASNSPQ
jgi:hypothetical protein